MSPAKRAAKPVPTEEEENEPPIRVAFSGEDMCRLLDKIEGWDDPVAHRLRLRYSKHRLRWP